MADIEELSASERAYLLIRDGVLEGTYAPGTMVGEASLAKEFSLSRTPVRLALGRLQQEGWIEIFPKRGALVKGLSERQIAELANMRWLLESTSVADAPGAECQRMAQRQLASIEAQQEAFAQGDLRQFVNLTIAFHRRFVEVSGNGIRLELYDRLADRHRFALFSTGDMLQSRCAEIIAEHKALVELMANRDAQGFADRLQLHMSDSGAAS
ncbi:GntR family transcriptional regulator [Glutamicibacter sp. PS]|uniref:GntR family transcriptional regulator n=1 Tax=Glutamicibacter sp. PS TaxID=3075634 RepID=UPI0028514D1B|nr:GntR family transcriptional regulator [Glutamicibacter sp. PS]MDR4534518.1 GntR family transcriptional regulator [Glutamicibacter sp. PS]